MGMALLSIEVSKYLSKRMYRPLNRRHHVTAMADFFPLGIESLMSDGTTSPNWKDQASPSHQALNKLFVSYRLHLDLHLLSLTNH